MEKKPPEELKLRNFFDYEETLFGFSDEQLEALCHDGKGEIGQPAIGMFASRLSVYGASNMYSLGRGLRALARFPQWFPIPASMDHGIDTRTFLRGYQETERSRYFISWSGWRARAEGKTNKKIHLTLHPMVAIRHKLHLEKLPSARGTLIFVPHSLPDWSVEQDFSESMEDFLQLPSEFHPLVFCIQMHDVNKGMHKKLRRYGIPIVSAGNLYHYWFADRFYSILRNFQWASSTDIGGHALLAEEMGVHFFLRGSSELREKARDYEVSSGQIDGDGSHRLRYMATVFSEFPPSASVEKDQFLDYALGTGVPTSEHRRRLRWFFLREIFLNFPNMVLEFSCRVRGKLLPR